MEALPLHVLFLTMFFFDSSSLKPMNNGILRRLELPRTWQYGVSFTGAHFVLRIVVAMVKHKEASINTLGIY